MTVAPILPPNASLPAPPGSPGDLVGWARRITKTIADIYSLLARRADSVLTHGLASERPAPQGSRRLFVATDTGEAHYDAGVDIVLTGGSGVPVTRSILTGAGLTGGGDLSADRTISAVFGAIAGSICQGNDARLSDARPPTAHASSHKNGGADEVSTVTPGANVIPKAGAAGTLALGFLPATLTGKDADTVDTYHASALEKVAAKGIASGYCDLDSTIKVPNSRIRQLNNLGVINVTEAAYGADPTGAADSSAAINAAIAALPAAGGRIILPPGTFKLTSSILIGNGSATGGTASTRNAIEIVGAGSYDDNPGSAATTLVWAGVAGGTMIDIEGLIYGVRLSGFHLNCAGLAATAIKAMGVHQSKFEFLSWRENTGAGFIFDGQQYASYVGYNATGGNVFSFLYGSSSLADSAGMQIGYTGAAAYGAGYMDPCQDSFYNLRLRYADGAATGRIGIILGFCDNLSFFHCLMGGTRADILVKPSAGAAGGVFPTEISLYHWMPGNAGIVVDETNQAYTAVSQFAVTDYEVGDGGVALNPRFAHGSDEHGLIFGRWGAPLRHLCNSESAAIANTAVKTAFSRSYIIPAYLANFGGARVKVAATGYYSSTGTPACTLTIEIGGVVVASAQFTTANNAAARRWQAEADIGVAWSSSATCGCKVGPSVMAMGGAAIPFILAPLAGAVGLNFNVDQLVTVSVTWGTASPSNTITLDSLRVEVDSTKNFV